MELVKKSKDYSVYKKRSSRYGVRDSNNKWINGDEKIKILLAEKLLKVEKTKKKVDKKSAEPAKEEPKVEEAEEKKATK